MPNPKARKPAYRLEIDFGPLGIRTSSAQLTALYSVAELIGRQQPDPQGAPQDEWVLVARDFLGQ